MQNMEKAGEKLNNPFILMKQLIDQLILTSNYKMNLQSTNPVNMQEDENNKIPSLLVGIIEKKQREERLKKLTMSPYYVLGKNNTPEQVPDVETWSKLIEKQNRVVKQEKIGDVFVSTVFLGININKDPNETPLLFETMIFGGEHDDFQQRYTTWRTALNGHKKAVELVKTADKKLKGQQSLILE